MSVELQTPDYYDQFRCLAAACPHSCCTGWEVVIDAASAASYAAVPGPLGEKLRRCLTKADGETCFCLTAERRCPFLEESGLCEIHRKLGEEYTSVVCREHPRFVTDFGPLREISLSAACPAVRDLLLGSEAPLTFPMGKTPDPAAMPESLFAPLRQCRDLGLGILRTRILPLNRRLAWLLLFANEVQALLDSDAAEGLPELCELYAWEPELPELSGKSNFNRDALSLLMQLEILEPDWPALLRAAALDDVVPEVPETVLERMACYWFFRYFLRSVFDGDALAPAQMTVFSVLAVRRLSGRIGPGEALRRFCREIEHCPENLNALRDAFCSDPRFALVPFFTALQTQN